MKNLYLFLSITMVFMACSPQRDLVYFSNLSKVSSSEIQNTSDLRLQKNDQITVSISSPNPEYNVLFASSGNLGTSNVSGGKVAIRINNKGTINLPLLGELAVEGLKIEEAQNLIAKEFSKQVKSPVVTVELINFKITVIGEVNKPSSLNVPGEQINLLEALGMAGDMTVYGKRDNVLVIREANGVRNMARLNLNDKNVYESPYFQLKQNDIVYIEPDKSKEKEYSPNNRALPIITACISAVAVLATALIR
ncbi:polysaccharide biosynthesis/export family protein [Pedobacter sp. ASV1-7]|uniref:polysaccharide biosynthesis/export family protein n=1 Tax=Pedobacter sp. ASV1-7 TaxID=3145237 RepID=UPI0032E885DB